MWIDEGIGSDFITWVDAGELAAITESEVVTYAKKTDVIKTSGDTASHVKSYITRIAGIQSDITLTDIVPAGYVLSKIVMNNPGALTNATDQISCGLSSTSFEVFTSHRIGEVFTSMINVEAIYSSTAATTLYIHTAGNNDSWGGVAYDFYFIIFKVI
jgi:hypothetical protein